MDSPWATITQKLAEMGGGQREREAERERQRDGEEK